MAFTEIDEKLLVRAYQAGDERAFDTIVRTQYNALFAHAVSRLRNQESAEDAVQDTLLRAYRALPNLDGDLALKAWLHRILTNVCHDEGNRLRRQQGLVEKVGALPEETAGDPAEEAVLYDTVRVMSEALKELPESYREALVLRYVDGLSFREVAEATGVTEENARARVHRGRGALHKIMARLAIIAAFVIPGLRRTPVAAPGTEHAAVSGSPDSGVVLMTQLTTHAVNHAPAAGRLMEAASATSGTKTTLVTAAVAAVAAVGVTGGAVVVNDVRRTERPPAQVAAPFPDRAETTGGSQPSAAAVGPHTAPPTAGAAPTTSSSTTSSTSSTLPRSAVAPFETTDEATASGSTPTSTSTSTTVPPTDNPVATVDGSLEAVTLSATGKTPNVDVAGPVTLEGDGRHDGTLAGRLSFHDDGSASGELTLTVDGTDYAFSYRGSVVEGTVESGARSWQLSGKFKLAGGTELGLAERGDLTGSFQRTDGDASLVLDLTGPTADDGDGTGASASATPTDEPATDDEQPADDGTDPAGDGS